MGVVVDPLLHYSPDATPLTSRKAQALGPLHLSPGACAGFTSFPTALVLWQYLPDKTPTLEEPLSLPAPGQVNTLRN